MRKDLKKITGMRERFSGQVTRFGTKSAFRGPPKKTVLLTQIQRIANAKVVTDHIWLTVGKRLEHLEVGDIVEFDARVGEYTKGYQGYRWDVCSYIEVDYRLERPTKVTVVGKVEMAGECVSG